MIDKEEIFVNESHWRGMNGSELDIFKQKIFDYYRSNGFPYYDTSDEYRNKELKKLKDYDFSNIIEGDIIKQSMHGLGLAWSFFPQSFNVQCGNKLTPIQAFCDDKIFMKIIEKRLKIGTYVSDSGIRKMIKMYSGVQGVSNFRPTAAAAIYKKFASGGVVWDMSGGWGGRLLGAMIGGVKKYIATEPAYGTFLGLLLMAETLSEPDFLYSLIHSGSEDYTPEPESLDLCFTSPPYFDLEKYDTDSMQSYVKYDNKREWVDGFLSETFKNCYIGLKPDKYMLINIADPKGKENICLEEETKNAAIKIGFKYEGYLKLLLSNPISKNRQGAYKYEPVFIFRK